LALNGRIQPQSARRAQRKKVACRIRLVFERGAVESSPTSRCSVLVVFRVAFTGAA
jgi:hypothetical protein